MSKYAIDFHGVIDDNPEGFKKLIDGCLDCGDEVWLVSGCGSVKGQIGTTQQYLFDHDIEVTGTVFTGSWGLNDEDWEKAKADWCIKNNVDVMIDDNEKFLKHFPDNIITLLYRRKKND